MPDIAGKGFKLHIKFSNMIKGKMFYVEKCFKNNRILFRQFRISAILPYICCDKKCVRSIRFFSIHVYFLNWFVMTLTFNDLTLLLIKGQKQDILNQQIGVLKAKLLTLLKTDWYQILLICCLLKDSLQFKPALAVVKQLMGSDYGTVLSLKHLFNRLHFKVQFVQLHGNSS